MKINKLIKIFVALIVNSTAVCKDISFRNYERISSISVEDEEIEEEKCIMLEQIVSTFMRM